MKRPAVFLALALLLATSGMVAYRIFWLSYPAWPTITGKTWQLEIDAHFKGTTKLDGRTETSLALALPQDYAGQIVTGERINSGSMSFNIMRQDSNRVGNWSGEIEDEEEIGYRATILIRPRPSLPKVPAVFGEYPVGLTREEQSLAESLMANWSALPPAEKFRLIAATATGRWGDPPPENSALRSWSIFRVKHGPLKALLTLYRAAQLPARGVEGIPLTQSLTTVPLRWVEVWTGKKWERVDVESGEIYDDPHALLPLAIDTMPAAQISGGELKEIRWVITRQVVSNWSSHFERIRRSGNFLDRWSLFNLPAQFQETFRILLLVPIGTLIISALRNLIGFPTFGIFMPVLIALSFRNTGLIYGVAIFSGVLLVGYAVRSSLDKLRLLLVSRMSVLLTMVIACFTILALIGGKFGLREFMAVGLLPFVILTMVIERFFILIEEAGVREGMRTAAGSAAVSVIAYGIIGWEFLQLTFFLYPELIIAVAAFHILLGRYSGLRLSELFRFRTLKGIP